MHSTLSSVQQLTVFLHSSIYQSAFLVTLLLIVTLVLFRCAWYMLHFVVCAGTFKEPEKRKGLLDD